MTNWLSLCLIAALCSLPAAHAAELTGRAALFGAAGRAEQGDIGYIAGARNTPTADQQSLRLMLDELHENGEWSLHLKTSRQHLNGFPSSTRHSSDLFRYRELSGNWLDQSGPASSTRIGYELDRVFYKRRIADLSISLGRQSVDWGTGRFWQPLNVFGSFAPTDLDTDFKPGIDATVVDWYPSAFSSLTMVYAFAPAGDATIDDSTAACYRSRVGERSGLSMLAGRVAGNHVYGGAFESEWHGMGWRIEGLRTRFKTTNQNTSFWIAGIDYQFEDGTLIVAEWYDNSRGARDEASLSGLQADPQVAYGLQQHLGNRILGTTLEKEITPLLRGAYQFMLSPLQDASGSTTFSMLHQINLTYSVSNESDLLFSLQSANGKGLNTLGQVQSEFGHLPASATLRLRMYF